MKILLDEVPVAGLPTSAIEIFVDRTPPTVHVELAPPTLPASTCEFVPESANIIVEDNLAPVPLAALSRITFDGADVPDDEGVPDVQAGSRTPIPHRGAGTRTPAPGK